MKLGITAMRAKGYKVTRVDSECLHKPS